jgi:hypothetical protein
MPESEAKVEWCWSSLGADRAHGPFPTREDCIAGARRELIGDEARGPGAQVCISVGQVKYARPEDWVEVDLDALLETAETLAADNDFGFAEDCIFEIKDEKGAEEDLRALLAGWARKWVTSSYWVMDDPVEEVVLVAGVLSPGGEAR